MDAGISDDPPRTGSWFQGLRRKLRLFKCPWCLPSHANLVKHFTKQIFWSLGKILRTESRQPWKKAGTQQDAWQLIRVDWDGSSKQCQELNIWSQSDAPANSSCHAMLNLEACHWSTLRWGGRRLWACQGMRRLFVIYSVVYACSWC